MKVASVYSKSHRALIELLKDLRVLSRMTQVDVAQALKRPQSYVSNLEAGRRGIDLLQVEEIVALYGYKLSTFVARFEREKRSLLARVAARERANPEPPSPPPKPKKKAAKAPARRRSPARPARR